MIAKLYKTNTKKEKWKIKATKLLVFKSKKKAESSQIDNEQLQQQQELATGVIKPVLQPKQQRTLRDLKALSNWPQSNRYVSKIVDKYGAPILVDRGAGLKWVVPGKKNR